MSLDFYPHRTQAAPETVAHCVLDDWLQAQMWEHGVQNIIIGVDAYGEPVLEADLLDREVHLEKLELTSQGDFLGIRIRENAAQQVREF
jgi:hypothetical protein